MRKLPAPELNWAEVLDACTADLSGADAQHRISAVRQPVLVRYQEYADRAVASQLHLSTASTHGDVNQLVIAPATKRDFTSLYDQGMVKGDGRKFYERLMTSAPLGKCPYCGFGHVRTLDHFLSKAYYPGYAVLPVNLVPACADCNKLKGFGHHTEESGACHPYYEADRVTTEVWLVASVTEDETMTVTYSAAPPTHWDVGLRRRVLNHFKELELSRRYAVEAASEIVYLRDLLRHNNAVAERVDLLARAASAECTRFPNSWKAALLTFLATNQWFAEEGCLL